MVEILPTIPYSLHEVRRLCRQVTRAVPEIVLGSHHISIHDLNPHTVATGIPVKEHVHSFYEGHIFLEGGGVYHTGREEEVGPAGTLLHGPHMPHSWQEYDTPAFRLLIWFSAEPAIPVFRPAKWPVFPDLVWDAYLLLEEVARAEPGWHHRATARLTGMISRLLSVTGWPDSPRPASVTNTDLVTMIDQLFTDNMSRPLTLADVSAHVGLSERTLCRQFLEITGETVMERLHNLRMDRAAQLLLDTDASIIAIGELVGMPDASYFCRRFNKHFHNTPARYRKGLPPKNQPAVSEVAP